MYDCIINIYTDGAHSSSSNVGGWAAVITHQNSASEFKIIDTLDGYEFDTTNNRMELYALLQALLYIATHNLNSTIYNIYTDSAYISNCFRDKWYIKWRSNNWRTSNKTPVLNKDLWSEILELYESLPSTINITRVEGHNGDEGNEYADMLAVQARLRGAAERNANENKK